MGKRRATFTNYAKRLNLSPDADFFSALLSLDTSKGYESNVQPISVERVTARKDVEQTRASITFVLKDYPNVREITILAYDLSRLSRKGSFLRSETGGRGQWLLTGVLDCGVATKGFAFLNYLHVERVGKRGDVRRFIFGFGQSLVGIRSSCFVFGFGYKRLAPFSVLVFVFLSSFLHTFFAWSEFVFYKDEHVVSELLFFLETRDSCFFTTPFLRYVFRDRIWERYGVVSCFGSIKHCCLILVKFFCLFALFLASCLLFGEGR